MCSIPRSGLFCFFSLCLLAGCHADQRRGSSINNVHPVASGVKAIATRTGNAINHTAQRVQRVLVTTARDTHKKIGHFAKEVRQAPTLARREIVFPFDSARISPDDLKLLQIHADFLKNHPHLKVILVEHADQRGPTAHNERLAEKRAEAVAAQLEHDGVARERITIRSAGVTRPRTTGRNEKDWLRNRRVEILYG